MRLHRKFIFLTLVLLVSSTKSWGAPDTTVYPDTMSPTETAIQDREPMYSIRAHTNSASTAQLFSAMGSLQESESLNTWGVGLSKTFYKLNTSEEWGVFATPLTLFGALWAYKWNYPRYFYEPFYSAGLQGNYSTRNQLGTLIDWQRYNLRVAAGFEDFMEYRRSVRVEFVATYGYFGTSLFLNLGFTFAD